MDHYFPLLDKPPTGSMRTKYWDTAGFILFFFLLLFTKVASISYVAMGILCFIAIAIAVYRSQQMWVLDKVQDSADLPRKLCLYIVVPTALFSTIVVLASLGKIMWSDLYFQVPLALFCGITGVAAWFTEWKKKVRIYEQPHGFVYVSIKPAISKNAL